MIVRVATVIGVLLGLLYASLPALSGSDWVRARIETVASDASGLNVTLAAIRIGYDLDVHAGDVRIAADDAEPFLSIARVEAELLSPSLLQGRLRRIGVFSPRLHLVRLPQRDDAAAPADEDDAASTSFDVPVDEVGLEDLVIYVGDEEQGRRLGPVSTTLAVDTVAGPWSLRGDLDLGAGPTAQWSLELDPPTLELTGEVTYDSSDLAAALAGTEATASEQRWQASGSIRIDGRLDDEIRLVHDGEISSPQLDSALGFAAEATLQPADMRVDFSAHLKPQAGPEAAGRFGGWSFAFVDVALDGEARQDDQGGWRMSSSVEIAAVGFHDEDYLHAGEKIEFRGRIDARRPADADADSTVDVELAVRRGEVAWDRWYVDFARFPIAWNGRFRSPFDALRLARSRLDVAGLGHVTTAGTVALEGDRYALQFGYEVVDLALAHEMFVREPFAESFPFLRGSALSGRATGSVDLRVAGDARSVSGRLGIRDGRIAWKAPEFILEGIDVDFPVLLGDLGTVEEQSGRISATALRVSTLQIPAFTLPFTVEPNRIELAEAASFSLAQGRWRIPRFKAERLNLPTWQAEFGLDIAAADLQTLCAAFDLPELRGSLTGEIPTVRIDRDRLQTEGQVRLEVFRGEVVIDSLRIDRLFTRVPSLEMDVAFDNVVLQDVTSAFDVGRIEGVARGAIQNLEIVNGQPQRFEAWLESVPTSDIDQTISVKAIEQISILGGAGGDPVSRVVMSLFDEYRYTKMGFRCRLENDRFYLRGIERAEDKEYLVVGSFLPPRVNVVSHTQVMGFSDMMRRIERIFRSPSSEEEGET